MYCPKCGAPAASDQKFCRACGWTVQAHVQALAGQSSLVEPDQASVERAERVEKRQRRIAFWGALSLAGGTLQALVAGHVYFLMGEASDAINPAMVWLLSWVTGIGLVILLIGLCLMGYWGFLKAPDLIPWPQSVAPPQAAPTAKLPSERSVGPSVSIAEHTTDRLGAEETPGPARNAARERE